MTAISSVLDANGHFRWDYLQCQDLEYPLPEAFQTTHVYRSGEVILQAGTSVAIHDLCVKLGLKERGGAPSIKDLGRLGGGGYILEAVTDDAAFHAARNSYHLESSRREGEFRVALIEREGLTGHPKADICYSKAHEQCHGQGLVQVVNKFIDLAELIR